MMGMRVSCVCVCVCRREWDNLFLNSNYLARTRQAGLSGRLRSSRFRSVCWKVGGRTYCPPTALPSYNPKHLRMTSKDPPLPPPSLPLTQTSKKETFRRNTT